MHKESAIFNHSSGSSLETMGAWWGWGGSCLGKNARGLEWPGLGSGLAIVPHEKVIRKWNLDQLTAGFVQERVGQEKCFWKLFCWGELNPFLQEHTGGDHIGFWKKCMGGVHSIYWKKSNLKVMCCLTRPPNQINCAMWWEFVLVILIWCVHTVCIKSSKIVWLCC